MTESFQRYLRAKRTVDDRALDRRVIDRLRERLSVRADESAGPLAILEIGAGIGTMLGRCIEWDVLPKGTIQYTAVDVDPDTIGALSDYLHDWADGREVSVTNEHTGTDDLLVIKGENRRIEVDPIRADAVAYTDDTSGYDLLIGAALLDILDRDRLPTLLGALAPGGLYYFPITFDGATRFQPTNPSDREIERHYHAHMDEKSGGNSRAGGEVLDRLRRLDGVTLMSVAGADWIVRPVDGTYPHDESYFLRYILDTIETAVSEMAGKQGPELDGWLDSRRAQVSAAELVYHTHQLDLLGSVHSPTELARRQE